MTEIIYNLFEGLDTKVHKILGGFANVVELVIDILFIIAVTHIIKSIIEKFANRMYQRRMSKKPSAKIATLNTITKSLLKYFMYTIMILLIIDRLGLGKLLSSILATAGIGGIAIAFGAQSLVKDVITGTFILFEDQYKVGDFVTIANNTGTVEQIQIRVTVLKAFTGEKIIIPNGNIDTVVNYSRGEMLAIVDIPMVYEADADTIKEKLLSSAVQYAKNDDSIVAPPECLGVVSLNNSNITLRFICKTKPMHHFGVERRLRQHLLSCCKEHGFAIPYEKLQVINKEC